MNISEEAWKLMEKHNVAFVCPDCKEPGMVCLPCNILVTVIKSSLKML